MKWVLCVHRTLFRYNCKSKPKCKQGASPVLCYFVPAFHSGCSYCSSCELLKL